MARHHGRPCSPARGLPGAVGSSQRRPHCVLSWEDRRIRIRAWRASHAIVCPVGSLSRGALIGREGIIHSKVKLRAPTPLRTQKRTCRCGRFLGTALARGGRWVPAMCRDLGRWTNGIVCDVRAPRYFCADKDDEGAHSAGILLDAAQAARSAKGRSQLGVPCSSAEDPPQILWPFSWEGSTSHYSTKPS